MAAFFYLDAGKAALTIPSGWSGDATEKRCMLDDVITFEYEEEDQDIFHHETGGSLQDRICSKGACRLTMRLRTIIEVASGIVKTMEGLAAMFGKATYSEVVGDPHFIAEDPSGANRRDNALLWNLAPFDDGVASTDVTKHIIIPKGSPLVTGSLPFNSPDQRAWDIVIEGLVYTETINGTEYTYFWRSGVNPA